MSTRNRRGVCAYCGKDKKLTDDHVPPKVLLHKPYPANLPTVPACADCNRGFQKDDEYTRAVLAVDVRAAGNPVARSHIPVIGRSLGSVASLVHASLRAYAGPDETSLVIAGCAAERRVVDGTQRLGHRGRPAG